jgi:PhnB protein
LRPEAWLLTDGRCEEAIEFYPKALGAETTMLMRFKESSEPAAWHGARFGEQNHACVSRC